MYTKDKNMGKAGKGVPGCIGGIRKYCSKKSEFNTVKNNENKQNGILVKKGKPLHFRTDIFLNLLF